MDSSSSEAHRRGLLRRIGPEGSDAARRSNSYSPHGRSRSLALVPRLPTAGGSGEPSPAVSDASWQDASRVVQHDRVTYVERLDVSEARAEVVRVVGELNQREQEVLNVHATLQRQAGELHDQRQQLIQHENALQASQELFAQTAREESIAFIRVRDELSLAIASAKTKAETEESRLDAESAQLSRWRAEALQQQQQASSVLTSEHAILVSEHAAVQRENGQLAARVTTLRSHESD